MHTVMGVMCACNTGNYGLIAPTSINNLKINLLDGEWYIGIDQSSSCTGITLAKSDLSYVILLDVKRDKNLDTEDYYNQLFILLRKIAKGHKFGMVIMEQPVPKSDYTSRFLHELRGRLSGWVQIIPEFEGILSDSILPPVWKSFVMDKSKGPNRSSIKRCIAEDIVDIIPELQMYFNSYPYKDYDSFDSCGILLGFLRYAFDADGKMLIHGMKEKRHKSVVGYKWVDKNNIKEAITALNQLDLVLRPTILGFNERYKLYDNIRMATSNWDFVITILPRSELEPFMWKYNVDVDDPDKAMIGYFIRRSAMSKNDLGFFNSVIPWHEEVYGDI